MNSFLAFVRKEFYHILRDRRSAMILFGMPIIQLLLFGYAIRNEISSVRVAIVDLSHDTATEDITDKLLSSGYFIAVENLSSSDELPRLFRSGKITEAIVFENGFGEKLGRENRAALQVITDGSNPNLARILLSYTASVVKDYQRTLGDAPAPGATGVAAEPLMLFNPELKSAYLFVPGLITLILMLVSALMTSISITREKENGTMEILLVSALKPHQIIIGKVVPYLALSFVNVVTVLVIAHLVFGVPCRGSVMLLLLESLLFIVTALSLGIFISTITSSQQVAMMISLAGLLLPTVMLSGFIFPVTSMPTPLQALSNIIPAKWFLIIVRGIMLKGVGIGYFWKETLILGAMTVLLVLVSVKKFSIRLE